MSNFIGEAVRLDSDDAKYFLANSEFLIKKYSAFYNNLIKSISQPIGTYKKSALSEADFISVNGSNWVLCDGQDITGTDYATLKGVTTAPDLVTEYSHLIQADDNTITREEIEDSNMSHSHFALEANGSGGTGYNGAAAIGRTMENRLRIGSATEFGATNTDPSVGTTSAEGETEALPNTTKVNFFLKVNRD